MPGDYYVVLGIPADSTEREIKAAYRRLAKEFHPDRRSGRPAVFLGIQEAYSVLGDPRRRKEYDASRRPSSRHAAPSRRISPSSPPPVEPLIPKRPPAAEPEPLRPHGSAGPMDHVFAGTRDEARPEHLALEVAITPRQARFGGVIRLAVPGRFACQACGGRGDSLFHPCSQCGGSGVNRYDYPLRLEFPPGVTDNTLLRVPLDSFGRRHASLFVRFRIRF